MGQSGYNFSGIPNAPTPPPAYNFAGIPEAKPSTEPSGDVVLGNIKAAPGAVLDVAKGAIKELYAQGIRGGAVLRKIPGVSRVSDALMTPVERPITQTNTAQRFGAGLLNVAEFGRAGRVAAKMPTLLSQAATGGAINAGLATVQGAGPGEVKVAAGLGALAPYITAALAASAERGSTKISEAMIKATQADYRNGFKAENLAKYDLGGSLTTSLEKTTRKIQALAGQLRAVLRQPGTQPIDLGQAYTDVAQRYLNNPQAVKAADFILDHVEFALNKQSLPLTAVVNLADANLAKQAVGDLGAWASGQSGMLGEVNASVVEDVANTFYDVLKKGIEAKASGPVAIINRQLADLIPIRSALIRRIPVAARSNALTLADLASLASGRIEPSLISRVLHAGPTAQALTSVAKGAPALQPAAQLGAAAVTYGTK